MSLPVRSNKDVLRSHIPISGSRVLDVGCGRGSLVSWMRTQGAVAVGIDPQEKLLAPGLVAAASEALPFGDSEFDSVIFFNSLHHVPKKSLGTALSEAARVSRSLIVVVEPVAAGSHFELVRPIDDETEVRAAALHAIFEAPLLEVVAEQHWNLELAEESAEQVIDGLIIADPNREARVAERHDELTERFNRLGRPSEKGMLFDQPMRLNVLRHRDRRMRRCQ